MVRLVFLSIVVAAGSVASACSECQSGEDYCEGNTLVRCEDSAWVEYPCDDQFCVETAEVFCTPEADPRPACPAEAELVRVCDGAERILCRYGYATIEEDCGNPDLCVAEVYRCLLRPGVEPLCASEGSHCFGSVRVTCIGDYVVEEEDCGEEELCYEGSDVACVESADVGSRCFVVPSDGVYHVCAGYLALTCVDSYLIVEENCTEQTLECVNGYCR